VGCIQTAGLDFTALNPGYQAATSLPLVTHRNWTALISLGIPKLVRFAQIRPQQFSTVLMVFMVS
jgi:hypothetical protein